MSIQAVASNTVIANLALSHLGQSTRLTDFTIGTTVADIACNLHFALCRDEMLRAAHWTFARKQADGTGKSELTSSSPYYGHWQFSYTYPTDCLMMRKIVWDEVREARIDHRQSIIPFVIDQNKIYTDQDDAIFEYTMQYTTATGFPVDFVQALSYLLASRIAAEVTGGDPFQLTQKAMALYKLAYGIAARNNLNEQKLDEEHDAEMIRHRNA